MSRNSPTVSALMPVFRTPPVLLREAVESILNQTFDDFELIIVEDPSNATAEQYVRQLDDRRIRYELNSQRTGLVSQRNRALDLAQGSLIAKVDSDDISEPQRFADQVEFLNANPEIGVVGSFLSIIDSAGKLTGQREYPEQHTEIYETMSRRNPIAQPAVCFRRKLYLEFGGYPEGFDVCQDYAYWSHLARNGVQFANLSRPLVRYRQHDHSIKSRRLRQTIDATIQIKNRYWSDQLSFGDRVRMMGERTLRFLPTAVTLEIFRRMTYKPAKKQSI